MCALTANGQSLAVANSLIRLNINLAANVGCDLAPEITFDLVVRFDIFTKLD